MKSLYLKICLITGSLTFLSFFVVIIQGCKKDPCNGITCFNGGTCNAGSCSCPTGYSGIHCETKNRTTITFKNNTPTLLYLIINGSLVDSLLSQGQASYMGTYGQTLTCNAFTYGRYSDGTRIGELVQWALSLSFPATGTHTENLTIGNNYYFFSLKNNSSSTVSAIYTNYGLTSEQDVSVGIPNDGVTYPIGYFKAYSNSNVRVHSALYNWDFSSAYLQSHAINQIVPLVVN